MHFVDSIIHLTNNNLSNQSGRPSVKAPINIGILFQWLGIKLAMVLEPRRGPSSIYWNVQDSEETIYTAANFGQRFKMTKNRYETILQCLTFGERDIEVILISINVNSDPRYVAGSLVAHSSFNSSIQ